VACCWSKHLQPLVKTIAANGQSELPSRVSLELPRTQTRGLLGGLAVF
jgi:hypothetical protein